MLMMAVGGGRGTRRQRPHLESVISACHLHSLLFTDLNLLAVRSFWFNCGYIDCRCIKIAITVGRLWEGLRPLTL